MAHREYLIHYSNGFKRHVSRQERDLLGDLQQLGPREYLSKASLQSSIEQTNGPHYLAGSFIFDLKGKKSTERMESTIGMVERLTNSGVLA